MSEPSARGTHPAATAAAEPPDEPPGVRSGFHGLRVMPQSGLSVAGIRELRGRGLADHDRPGAQKVLHDQGVEVGHPLLVCVGAKGRALAPGRREVLDRDRDPVQRSGLRSVPDRALGLTRALPRFVRVDEAEAVQDRVDLLDAGEAVLDRLDRRQLAAPDQIGDHVRGRVGKLEVRHVASSAARAASSW
jgi:hypothetical protein